MNPNAPAVMLGTYPGFDRIRKEYAIPPGTAACPATRAMELVATGVDRIAAVRHAEAALADPRCRTDQRCVWRAAVALTCANVTRSWDSRLADLAAEGGCADLVALVRARAEFFLGNPHTSREALTRLAGSADTDTVRDVAVAWLAELLIELGDPGQAAAVLADYRVDRLVEQRRQTKSVLLAARAAVRVATGEHGGVADYLACGRELAFSGIGNPAVLSWQGLAALAARDTELAGRLAAQELTAARRWGAPRALGRALYASALVADDETSIPRLEEAVHLLELSMTRTHLVHALLELGVRLAARNEVVRARTNLASALELATQSGNAHRVAQVDAAVRRLSGATPPSSSQRGRS
ncbi:hypothetical protein GCM10010174_33750 [Kutzneria viridogrisea]|uniref:Uncharacterized protein n=2 Tax=Kutzneria TaxID=43356 RepID=W5W8G0_9PSEU|nr:hypothetical protein [Kutzneria albida]AHH96821.1 hypothetical protein KALB_3456 [Kutzneria albida DSM 43870]MBA8927958.1 hypothetical protein [Kutzneria viridogrisea]